MTPSLRSQFTHNWFPRFPVPEFGLDLGLHRKASFVVSSLYVLCPAFMALIKVYKVVTTHKSHCSKGLSPWQTFI